MTALGSGRSRCRQYEVPESYGGGGQGMVGTPCEADGAPGGLRRDADADGPGLAGEGFGDDGHAEPGRDPRGWLPSIAYLALVPPEELPEEGGRPAEREAGWHPVDDLPELALDHETIVDDGLWRLKARVAEKTWFLRVAGALLPAAFTLAQAQRLYEALRGETVDAANFRRDVRATGLLADTGETHSDGPGRPGRLYRRL